MCVLWIECKVLQSGGGGRRRFLEKCPRPEAFYSDFEKRRDLRLDQIDMI